MPQTMPSSGLSRKFILLLLVFLALAEMIALAVAWNMSGKKSWLQVQNSEGAIIYETRGDTLTRFDRYYFEQNFGPLENYHTRLVTREIPFPMTAWLFTAIGVPVGLVLFMAFFVKVWRSLFSGKPEDGEEESHPANESWGRVVSRMDRPGVFMVGGLVFVSVLALWVLPALLSRAALSALELVLRFRWIFAVLFTGVLSLCFWFLYLRYRLAAKAMDARLELERLRLHLEMEAGQVAYKEEKTQLISDNGQGKDVDDRIPPETVEQRVQ
ncbi:hypothetical protein LZ24_02059 [Desulfobotulus alkaliphilus]|uniref:Uncharacterized protein n=1 Tax=Desulfobotulus alkaliphilus TaxID=622671 RepID=A0A562RQ18_9BACT|nr:hypothetical protein [Desulfobotulus alkaliphilus]TWI71098.1 hypothetical protein LZ24_02059 [Desulfobotulus alkaliphilus]